MDETQMQSGLVVVMVTAVPLMYLNKKKKRKPRWHERPHLGPIQRSTRGQQATLHIMRIHDPQSFFRTLPFYPEDFDKLLHMVGPYITKANIRRESVNPSTRLALTLRYLATGEKQSSIALSYLIGETTAREIIWETTWVIWKVLEPLVMPQPNEQLFEDVADGFWKRWDVPNCCGSLDGKLIRIKMPPHSGSEYYCYKSFHATILLGLADSRYRFLVVDSGAQGRQSDGGVFANSDSFAADPDAWFRSFLYRT